MSVDRAEPRLGRGPALDESVIAFPCRRPVRPHSHARARILAGRCCRELVRSSTGVGACGCSTRCIRAGANCTSLRRTHVSTDLAF